MNTRFTKVRTVTVSKKDVFFDVDMLSLYYSETSGDNLVRADRIATETASPNGRRIITRMCDHRASDLRHILGKYIDPVSTEGAGNGINDADWVFNIRVSTEVEDSIFPTLADLFHEYIVSGALADFYAHIGVNGNREPLQKQTEDALERIRTLIHTKPMP